MWEALFSIMSVGGVLIISQLSPGPDVFFVFRTALAQGFRAGSMVGAGISAGFLLQTILVGVAGSWVMEQNWSRWVLLAAAAWLLYLAWRIFPFRAAANCVEQELGTPRNSADSLATLFRQGFLCNILNPKCTLFICGLALGPIAMFGERYVWYPAALMLGMSLSGLLGWMLWSALLQWKPVQHFYMAYACGIDALFALLLAIFAVLLVAPAFF